MWLVDNKTDKVFKYTGAASRLSGSQNAASSFNLAAGNTNPQGIADPWAAGAEVQEPLGRRALATTSMRVIAVDDYLTSDLDKNTGCRSESLADSFLETLFGLDQRRAKLRSLKHSLR